MAKKTDDNRPVAVRDWSTTALVRIVVESTVRSVDPDRTRTFRVGEELEMIQWGREGREVDRDTWWTSTDIDGAQIVKADTVEVVRVIDERDPMVADCGAKKPGGYTYEICHRDEGHTGNHRSPYDEDDGWPQQVAQEGGDRG